MNKVTDPRKIVTDRHVLSDLTRQGIDPDYVEFFRDYAPRSPRGFSPFAKTYRDLQSGRYITKVSSLPRVRADGRRIQPAWNKFGQRYAARENLFLAEVNNRRVDIQVINAQPDGRRVGDRLSFEPQLFINNVEKTSGLPVLLDEDPVNSHYQANVIIWDYGDVKRMLRVIEGRVQGFWLRPVGFNREIRIKYNQSGNFDLKLGQYQINPDEERVPAEIDTSIYLPTINIDGIDYNFIQDSATFNPDADPESTSCDGTALRHNEAVWGDCHDAASGTVAGAAGLFGYILARISGGLYRIDRCFTLFDTSPLGAGASVSAGTLGAYGEGKTAGAGRNYNVFSANPGSDTDIVLADYSQVGTTKYCDTDISQAAFQTGSPGTANTWVLNATGIAAINKSGISKFSIREVDKDVGDSAPADDVYVDMHFADKGVGYEPYLTVTYTAAPPTVTTQAATIIKPTSAYLNGTVTALNDSEVDERGFDYGESGVIHIGVNSTAHTNYGLSYPVTYKINIPGGSSNLTAWARKAASGNYSQLTEKESGDFFNGIECVRFDYAGNAAYVSVSFAGDSDDIYILIKDSNGDIVTTITFNEICEYYDNRTAVVTFTADDGGGASQDEQDCIDQCQSRSVWLSDGFVIFYNPVWATFQAQIDQGFLEIASHSYNHQEIPYDDYDVEVGDSRDAIIDNLDLPDDYKKGSSEYVPLYIEPYGQSDATLRSKLGEYKYLVARSTTTGVTAFVAWDGTNGLYLRAGYTKRLEDETEVALNAAYDAAYAAGGIYHLQCHPTLNDWSSGQKAQNHLDYISEKTDVWYVGFGALYMYHYCQERGQITVDDPGYTDEITESGSFSTGAFSLLLSGLNPRTLYLFRAKAHTVNGWGYGSGDSFTTRSASLGQNAISIELIQGGFI